VILLRRQGRAAFGVDWSLTGLARARAAASGTPFAAMDLAALGFPDGAFHACISLGVVEHDPHGPDGLLAELRRVLRPDGVLVVSVPYINGLRRLGTPLIRRRGRAIARAGGRFYQYAFGRREFSRHLDRHGFRVRSVWPYDPARILRHWLRRGGLVPAPAGAAPAPEHRGVGAWARRALYAPPTRALLGHMILFVATREPSA